jgi:ferredoxin-NADP reductase
LPDAGPIAGISAVPVRSHRRAYGTSDARKAAIIQRAHPSRLIEKIPRVADIASFRLERPRKYEYRAGQWFVITFPGPLEPYTHHFSHSNSPLEPELEFTTRLRGSEFKNALDALPLNTEVELEGPYGTFTLPDGLEQVAFIAGGIGITCVRSILRGLADRQDASEGFPRSIVLLFANRSEDSVPFRDELEHLEARLPGLRVIHVISQPGKNWYGYQGHVDTKVLDRELQEPQRWTYYLSGPPTFGQSMQEQLMLWGVDPESIKVERFEGYE